MAFFALFNLVLMVVTFAIGMQFYRRRHPDTSAIKGSRLLGPSVRGWYFSNLDPFEDWLIAHRVAPAVLSWAQLVVSMGAGAAYAGGLVYLAGFLVLFTGTLDILDGKIARRTSGATNAGAFLDSVIDRYAEFISYAGLVFFFRPGWEAWVVLFAILGGTMVSYTRARAEGLGVSCEIGLLQRPERFVLLGFGSIFSSIATHIAGGEQILLKTTLILLAVLSNVTAIQRAIYVHRELRRQTYA